MSGPVCNCHRLLPDLSFPALRIPRLALLLTSPLLPTDTAHFSTFPRDPQGRVLLKQGVPQAALQDWDNPWQELGVPADSDEGTIKKAYRKLVLQCERSFLSNSNTRSREF